MVTVYFRIQQKRCTIPRYLDAIPKYTHPTLCYTNRYINYPKVYLILDYLPESIGSLSRIYKITRVLSYVKAPRLTLSFWVVSTYTS